MLGTYLLAAALVLDRTYTNERFGFVVRYPSAALVAQREADNGDGREWRGRRGHVLAFASLMPEDREDVVRAVEGTYRGRVTYRASGPTWFVRSGHLDARRDYYHKVAQLGPAWAHLVFEYDRAAAGAFRPMIEAMAPAFPFAGK